MVRLQVSLSIDRQYFTTAAEHLAHDIKDASQVYAHAGSQEGVREGRGTSLCVLRYGILYYVAAPDLLGRVYHVLHEGEYSRLPK